MTFYHAYGRSLWLTSPSHGYMPEALGYMSEALGYTSKTLQGSN
jgi:hypothetical protein